MKTVKESWSMLESTMSFTEIPRRGLSPLWIIAIFLSFSETVLGIAVTQTSGGIQIALTAFVIGFPATVGGLFFLVLWKKPYVFYPPTEFSNAVDVKAYVEAMQYSRGTSQVTPVSEVAIKNIETKMTSILVALEGTNDPKQKAALILRGAVEAVRESVIQVDSRPLFGKQGRIWEESFDPKMPVWQFLNNLYFEMQPLGLPAFTYGDVWAIKEPEANKPLLPAGNQWAELNRAEQDTRTLSNFGLRGGMKLEIVPLPRR